ncbi:hypothetical protein [Actinoallomurus sp. NPDC050550]|uniref:hypothetical protein n=1 Tax=Actinoallomurus sp. NPDC050550 TaxID=3154937 RepID=UPI0033D41857
MTSADVSERQQFSPTPEQLIAGTDWGHLEVIVGPEQGCPTVRESLTVLLEGAPSAQARALRDLGEAINHQNSIAEATAPALLVVAALLTDSRTDQVTLPALPYRTDTPTLLRQGLLLLVANAINDAGDEAEAAARHFGHELLPAELQVRSIRPALLPAACALLCDPDLKVRQAAALTVIRLLEDLDLASQHTELKQQAELVLAADSFSRPRAGHLTASKDAWVVPADGGFDDHPPF